MTKNNEVAVVQRGNTLPPARPETNVVTPFTDVYETDDAFVLQMDMPGTSKDAIRASVEKGALVVRAAVESYHKENVVLLCRELRDSTYYRVFNLGDGINRDNIEAQFEQGVMTVKLFKKEELKPREITIK